MSGSLPSGMSDRRSNSELKSPSSCIRMFLGTCSDIVVARRRKTLGIVDWRFTKNRGHKVHTGRLTTASVTTKQASEPGSLLKVAGLPLEDVEANLTQHQDLSKRAGVGSRAEAKRGVSDSEDR